MMVVRKKERKQVEEDKEQKCPECAKGAPGWLATFADLCTLLLTFFVLLLSFANTDLIKYKEALGSIKDAFGVSVEEPGEFEGKTPNPLALDVPAARTRVIKKEIIEQKFVSKQDDEKSEELKALAKDAEEAVKKSGEEKDAEVHVAGGKVLIRANERIFFDLGNARIKKRAIPFLEKITEVMKKFNYDLTVEGHTDNIPIVRGKRYPSNWELSGARASSVVRYFEKYGKILPIRLTATGYGSSRPIAPNKTKAGRAKNRRVEFLFSESTRPQKYNKKESDKEQHEVF
jgi:chemotaxis protein MotB